MVTVLDELTVPNLLYLLWFFICLIVHIRSRNPIAILRRIWLIIVLVSGINLIARYAFQFVDVAKIDLPDIPPDASTCLLVRYNLPTANTIGVQYLLSWTLDCTPSTKMLYLSNFSVIRLCF